MKTFRLIGIGLFAVVLSFSIASCGGDDEEDDIPDNPTKEDVTPSEPTPEDPDYDDENDDSTNNPNQQEPNVKDLTGEIQGHTYVDLGLPSGTLWADRNIGANSPSSYGDFFAWGETKPKDGYYYYKDYKWKVGNDLGGYTKYCSDSSWGYNGFVDYKTILEPEDDAATVNWGDKWSMPTPEQFKELIFYCSWEWIEWNRDYEVTGPNGMSIIVPDAGGYLLGVYGFDHEYGGKYCFYWTNTLENTLDAYTLQDEPVRWDGYRTCLIEDFREYGLSVRAVVRAE